MTRKDSKYIDRLKKAKYLWLNVQVTGLRQSLPNEIAQAMKKESRVAKCSSTKASWAYINILIIIIIIIIYADKIIIIIYTEQSKQ